jgi:hypothetical protein
MWWIFGGGRAAENARIPDQRFEAPLGAGNVSLTDVVLANAMRSPFIERDKRRRKVGAHYEPLLRAAFLTAHPDAQIALQDGAGLAVCLYGENDGGDLVILVLRNTIRFDWTAGRRVQTELNEVDEDAARLLPATEQRAIRLGVFSVLSQVQTAVGRENKRHPLDVQEAPATQSLGADLNVLEPQVAGVRVRLEEEGQRAAQITYTKGMAEGAALLGLLCVALAGVFLWQDVRAVNGVGALAGGIGACLSVLERLTRRRLRLDYRSERHFLRLFGGVRPIVGATFGTIAYCVIRADLLPAPIVVPSAQGALLAFVAFFAFFAGFSERFFQDMLRSTGIAGSTVSEEETSRA